MTTSSKTFSLLDRFTLDEGRVALSGVQALVRLPLDQHRADRRAGLRTATFISGYRGSPLGGYDSQLALHADLLREHDVRFVPGVNEELGATAVFGSQLANTFPNPKYDGVLGIWYGKGPGVDRSGDAFKHANLTGVGRHGGVLALAGDDPASKSSTVPSASEIALSDAQMPVLFPADVQDVLDLGLAGFALSRYSGLWVGFKIVTNVADEFSTVAVSAEQGRFIRPDFEYRGKPWQPTQSHALYAPYNLALEQEQFEGKLEAARRFAAANGLNRITVSSPGAWLGIAAAGKTYLDVREALHHLGFDDAGLERAGIRLLRVGMLYPLEPGVVREFARGLDEIVVVEEKRPFLEVFVRDALYHQTERPRVVGKVDDLGVGLIPAHGELEADGIAPLLARRLAQRLAAEDLDARLARLAPVVPPSVQPMGLTAQRLAYFCSGCPHNRSTVVPDGSIAAVGIGCHGMAVTMERSGAGFTQMGGEGAQWVGVAPFTETPHLFQNIGDGTLFHSGSLAVRQAVAANVNLTYKILYNGAVAMTGGQPVDGGLGVPALTRELEAEGVRRTLVLTDEPERYDGVTLATGVEVWPRERLDEAQRLLREVSGVTALIYDQHCAADLRRLRKRGLAPERPMRVVINERICEGCGDCGVKSNCLSVQPVETEFGRKTRIHQSSCNTDYSCLEGDCPAFMTVTPDPTVGRSRPASRVTIGPDLPEPERPAPAEANLYLMGIGGTGVVTVNQILGTAALLDGKWARCLDQTGLSQKGGAVVSHCKITTGAHQSSNKVGVGAADAYLAFDVLTASDARHLTRARPDRTVGVVSSSHVPTGLMVRNRAVEFPADSALHQRIDAVTDAARNVYLDAEALADRCFGSHFPANLVVVGAAYQLGLVPLSAVSIERAIELNGTAVEMNVQAFRVGRQVALDPTWADTLGGTASDTAPPESEPGPEARALIDPIGATGELARLLRIRVPDLIAYQNAGYARQYTDLVGRVTARERELGTDFRLSRAVARYLYQLMAYKDEYEVARLAFDPGFRQELTHRFGAGVERAYRFHPPLLRSLGLQRKLALGRWFDLPLGLLRRLRGLRGTPFDPFGYHPIRKLERRLVGEYRGLIDETVAGLTEDGYERAVALASLPDLIRGYESVKLAGVARYQARLAELRRPAEPAPTPTPSAAPATTR
jgi:indolepyruvate ferredoxin oxidoreductase